MNLGMQLLQIQLYWQIEIFDPDTRTWWAWGQDWQYGDYERGNKRAAQHAARNITTKYGWKTRVRQAKYD